MKEPWEWEEEDIAALVKNNVQEGDRLDYKDSRALEKTSPKRKHDVSKDVTAFANAAGGTLVYGVMESHHLPTGIDDGLDPVEVSREWLEQTIRSSTERPIDGLKIKQVILTSKGTGRVAYVVHVPQAKRPQMADDGKFYKRYNFESVPMAEYEVWDAARRIEAPDLELSLAFDGRLPNIHELEYSPNEEYSHPITVRGTLHNHSPVPVKYAVIKFLIHDYIRVGGTWEREKQQTVTYGEYNDEPVNVIRVNWIGNLPVWEGVSFDVPHDGIQLTIPLKRSVRGVSDYLLRWEIDAPSMHRKRGWC